MSGTYIKAHKYFSVLIHCYFSTHVWLPGTVLGIAVNKTSAFMECTFLSEWGQQRINKFISKIHSDVINVMNKKQRAGDCSSSGKSLI
jgi:hypothetical protein